MITVTTTPLKLCRKTQATQQTNNLFPNIALTTLLGVMRSRGWVCLGSLIWQDHILVLLDCPCKATVNKNSISVKNRKFCFCASSAERHCSFSFFALAKKPFSFPFHKFYFFHIFIRKFSLHFHPYLRTREVWFSSLAYINLLLPLWGHKGRLRKPKVWWPVPCRTV
jgi:hypothetical protein